MQSTSANKIEPVKNKLWNLNNRLIDILGKIRVDLEIDKLRGLNYSTDFHILDGNNFEGDIILGREFLEETGLTLVYSPSPDKESETIGLFSNLPLFVEDKLAENTI